MNINNYHQKFFPKERMMYSIILYNICFVLRAKMKKKIVVQYIGPLKFIAG